ncbi:MAG: alpha-galactosidase [Acidobacteriota bacterium]
MKRAFVLLWLLWLPVGAERWQLGNGVISATFGLTPEGMFEFQQLGGWPVTSSPLRFTVGNTVYDAQTRYVLVSHRAEAIARDGYRESIVLEDAAGLLRVQLDLEMFPYQPVLRYAIRLRNLSSNTVKVRQADMLAWSFADRDEEYRVFRVNQWAVAPRPTNFEPVQSALSPAGTPFWVRAGAGALHCGWVALRDRSNRGLFAGWEFDGRTDVSIRHFASEERLQLSAPVLELNHALAPGQEFAVPAAFIGLFRGDWDEAGFRTQRFAEAVLAAPPPDEPRFPYVVWNSWGYQLGIGEQILRRNAELAAALGVELFVVDLGWALRIGDWREDPEKFPSGLRALSDYVHSLGMRFGLHFALGDAAPDSEVLLRNPDWTSSADYGYHGARALCLAHEPVQEWLIEQAQRLIEEYNVDWVLQDGQTMVRHCTKTTHTHAPDDSNYSNAVLGLNEVIAAIRQRRPQTHWEHCANGGNMMTFNMVRHYVTSITNDASGALDSRQAVYGATYPFPPRYANRYMPEEDLDPFTTRSYMFGGPWVLMNRLLKLTAEEREFLADEIAVYKTIRGRVRDGKVFHLTGYPNEGRIDALQSYQPEANAAVVIVTRDGGSQREFVLRPRGLRPASTYTVRFQDDPRVLRMTGAQLARDGVPIRLETEHDAELVYIDPLR